MRSRIETFVVKQVIAVIPSGKRGFVSAVFEMLSHSGLQIVSYPNVECGAGVVGGDVNEVVAIEHSAVEIEMRPHKFPRLRSG